MLAGCPLCVGPVIQSDDISDEMMNTAESSKGLPKFVLATAVFWSAHYQELLPGPVGPCCESILTTCFALLEAAFDRVSKAVAELEDTTSDLTAHVYIRRSVRDNVSVFM